jgi:hypothetical protein
MDQDQRTAITNGLREIRDAVGEILRRDEKLGRPAGAILAAIAKIESAVIDSEVSPARSDSGVGPRRRRNKPKRYARETVGGIEMLAEYRDDSVIPLRTPKEVLFAVAEILSTAAGELSFGELQAELERRFGAPLPDYRPRIALRYLMSDEVGFVSREKARYALCEATAPIQGLDRSWKTLVDAESSKGP